MNDEVIEEVQLRSALEIALEEADKAKPSPEPSYWAKRSCTKCYGRGIEGKIITNVGDGNTIASAKICICAQARFARWKKAWVDTYLRNYSEAPTNTKETTSNV